MSSHRTSDDNKCDTCGRTLNAATAVEDGKRPMPGSVSICWYCGVVRLFDDQLRLRKPNDAEALELSRNRQLSALVAEVRLRRERLN